ncbi:MAG: GGDEF domain-containing protein [Sphaerochaeta sp.]|uniref:GGDEF domain-containing protein n=1 Tax=Sphaerochaeta sp. TaxID=1972642 RepID=UPI002FCB2875
MYQDDLAGLTFSLFNTIPDPFFVISEDGTYLEVFGGTERSLYDDGRPLKGKNIYTFMPRDFADFFMEQVRFTMQIKALNTFNYKLETDRVQLPIFEGPGGVQWFEARMYPLEKPYQGKRAVTVMLINITERRNLHKRLQELSYLDPLTGLYNRRYFLERVQMHLLNKSEAHIMICDIDHFKSINDQYGHLAGDVVLKEFAAIAKKVLKQNQTIARFGGDEFVVALTDMSDRDAMDLGERLRSEVQEYVFRYQDLQIRATMSVGIARVDGNTLDGTELVHDADRALYQAKEAGRNLVRMFISK